MELRITRPMVFSDDSGMRSFVPGLTVEVDDATAEQILAQHAGIAVAPNPKPPRAAGKPPMLKLDVTADLVKATGYLSDLAQQCVPDAAAKALTRTAFDARDDVRDSLPERFTLRRPWIRRGIGITPAQPRRMTALVWSRDRFMAEQESGGTKRGKLAIPLGPMARIAQTRVLAKSLWPGQVMVKANVFYRAGAVFERRDDKHIQALYLLRKQQKVAPRLGMGLTVRSVALREYQRQMERALREIR